MLNRNHIAGDKVVFVKILFMCNMSLFLLLNTLIGVPQLQADAGKGLETDSSSKDSTTFNRSVLVNTDSADNMQSVRLPSKAKSFFLSLCIPGSGEYYAGSKKMAKIFIGMEIVLWASYFSMRTYGNWLENDYKLYAVGHAGVQPAGKDHDFYVDIENYQNRTAFNEAKLKQRDVDALYPDKPDTWWQWDSESSRIKYKKMRIKSDDVYRGAVFIIGGVFVNHLVSAFDALRVARNAERRKENGIILGMTGLPEGGFRVVLLKHF